jgi:HEAT repeat protein
MREVVADHDGIIQTLLVGSGDRVRLGQELAVLEAYGGHVSYNAECAGLVDEILVRPGEAIQADDLLMRLEECAPEEYLMDLAASDYYVRHLALDRLAEYALPAAVAPLLAIARDPNDELASEALRAICAFARDRVPNAAEAYVSLVRDDRVGSAALEVGRGWRLPLRTTSALIVQHLRDLATEPRPTASLWERITGKSGRQADIIDGRATRLIQAQAQLLDTYSLGEEREQRLDQLGEIMGEVLDSCTEEWRSRARSVLLLDSSIRGRLPSKHIHQAVVTLQAHPILDVCELRSLVTKLGRHSYLLLNAARDSPSHLPALRELLGEIAELSGDAVGSGLVTLLGCGDANLEHAAADTLVEIGPGAGDALLEVLPSASPRQKQQAVEVLGRLRLKRAVPALEVAARDADPGVAQAAAEALDRIGSIDLHVKLELGSPDSSRRRAAVKIVPRLGETSITIAMLSDPDDEVRTAAVEALKACEEEGVTQALLGCLEKDASSRVRVASAAALARQRERADVEAALIRALESEEDFFTAREIAGTLVSSGIRGRALVHALEVARALARDHEAEKELDALYRGKVRSYDYTSEFDEWIAKVR